MINVSHNKFRKFKKEIFNNEINKLLNDSFSIPKEKVIYFHEHTLFNQNNIYKNYILNSSNTITTASTSIIKNDLFNSKIINHKINENKSIMNHNIKKKDKPKIKEKKKVSFDKNFIEIINVKNWKKYNKINNIQVNERYKDFKTKVEYCKCILF